MLMEQLINTNLIEGEKEAGDDPLKNNLVKMIFDPLGDEHLERVSRRHHLPRLRGQEEHERKTQDRLHKVTFIEIN